MDPNIAKRSTSQGEMRQPPSACLSAQQTRRPMSVSSLCGHPLITIIQSRRPSHSNPQNGGEHRRASTKRALVQARGRPPHRESRQSLNSKSSSPSPPLQLFSPRLKLGPPLWPITEFVLEFLAVRCCRVPIEVGKPSRKTGVVPQCPICNGKTDFVFLVFSSFFFTFVWLQSTFAIFLT
ncbi:hypothetical protein VUR80DRAFT_5272 [Thermomyces stellatus]